ncbi:MAG TPA: hypothetical protein VER12_14315 [Polyangiaceae bacterium]|nr:hypothetical protein [Polyangiaceae bacterium]
MRTQLRPALLASYSAASARASQLCPLSPEDSETSPIETVSRILAFPVSICSSDNAWSTRSARSSAL